MPSFIVTLAFYFILRGLSLALSTMLTGKTILSSHEGVSLRDLVNHDYLFSTLFAGHVLTGLFDAMAQWGWIAARDGGGALAIGVPKVIVWWIVLTALGAIRAGPHARGNWILAVGGDPNAAKNTGVPVARVKIGLFILTALCSCLFAVLQVADAGSAAADRGLQKEFEAIIAAVIGGCLLTRRLWFGRRRVDRRADLRHGADRHRLHEHRQQLVSGVPGRHAARRGVVQQLHPQARRARPSLGTFMSVDHILQLEDISKYFGSVIALNGVTLA